MEKYLDINYYLHLWDKITGKPQATRGFIPYEPEGIDVEFIATRDEVLGNTRPVLIQSGDWQDWTPKGERQKRLSNDTMACVSFSAANCLETLLNFYKAVARIEEQEEHKEIVKVFEHFGLFDENGQANVSDRYIAKLSGTTYRGNSFKNVWNSIRHYGFVPEADWPYAEGWNNYYAPVPQNVIEKGKKIVQYLDINYEFISGIDKQREAKKFGPVQTSVYAWNGRNSDGSYYPVNYQVNHATVLEGDIYKKNYKVFDSYEPFHKKTTWDFNFSWGLLPSIHLKKKLDEFNKEEIKKLIEKGVQYVLLVDNYKEYTRGLWQITTEGLEKVEANEVDEGERNNAFIMQKKDDGQLVPMNEISFKKLIN